MLRPLAGAETCSARPIMTATEQSKQSPEEEHLIVAHDEEVTIEHHPENWLALIVFWRSLLSSFCSSSRATYSTTASPGPRRSRVTG
jgi:hypothetical protein